MSRRIVTMEPYDATLAALERLPEAARVANALVRHASRQPDRAAALPGMRVRVLCSRSYERYPALRLFYCFDDEAIYLLTIEPYDELDP